MSTMTRILLVYPNFDAPSFWDFRKVCEVTGSKASLPPLGLITIAALFPPDWEIRLVDRNIEPLTDTDLDWADLVFTGGMIPQRPDTKRIVELAKARGKPVVVGGPDVTSSPDAYAHAAFRILGEAETTIADLVAAWQRGERTGTFEAPRYQTDITASPVPRFDLLKIEAYLSLGVQFSRGCPFTCEFCDIIELYGRVPRTKASEQMLAELDALIATGFRGTVYFVDDNLIGNKKAVKAFLPHLISWLEERGYPIDFATEASINLADDEELLKLLAKANFGTVFVGIESPDPETLVSTSKKQNVRRALAESVERIYDAGIMIAAGFIIGFDTEKGAVADGLVDCIEENDIPCAMVGLLTALPETQLTRRLIREGRLDPGIDLGAIGELGGDQCTAGLNFTTVRPRRDILTDYRNVLARIYGTQAFFDRNRNLMLRLRRPKLPTKFQPRTFRRDAMTVLRMLWWLVARYPEARWPYLRTLVECLVRNPAAVKQVVSQMVFYFHLAPFSRYVIDHLDREIASLDAHGDPRAQIPAAAS
ncbi:MAG TPA: B12-binding domain-containing radical SAM protein [Kaistiaceae bacterium]|nr:B12-binding domain-containing radical SAM protein [Kaistiaceae bacterium]